MSCPLACPVAWSRRSLSGCVRARFFAGLPANDFVSVRPVESLSRSRCGHSAIACSPIREGLRGEVVLCPLPSPFAWTTPPLPLRLVPLPLPAKEKADGEQAGRGAGGGRS
jgi:hypothetical protein